MTLNESSALLRLLDDLIPWFRPCDILATTIDVNRLPPREDLEHSLSGWLSEDATKMIDVLVGSNSQTASLAFDKSWQNAKWVDEIPAVVEPARTILAFTRPAIVVKSRLALILYYTNGPRAIRPTWMIAALARNSPSEEWETVVQRGPIFGELS